MIVASSFAHETVGIFGLARSGLSAARALREGGARVYAWDDRDASRLAAAKEGVILEPWERWPWHTLKAVILSPGVPLTHPEPHAIVVKAREAGAEVIGDIELFARALKPEPMTSRLPPVIAITGTNGKSTSTALIGHILNACGYDAQVGGNIGKPVLELDAPGPKTVYVLEMSSYQIDLSPGLKPDVAVLTNLSPDHLDRHGTMEHYAAVKAGLIESVRADGHAVLGVDDAYSAAIYTRVAAQRGAGAVPVAVGKVLGKGVFVIDGKLYDAWDQPAAHIMDLKAAPHLPGAHNWQNAALSYAAVKRLVRDARAVTGAMARFPGLAHRMEDVGTLGNIRFVNDSKATNADAAARALACYDDIYWIAGGKAKEGGIADLAAYFPRMRKAYLIGDAAGEFSRTLEGRVALEQSATLDRALQSAFADARASGLPEPVVLLSPACASFDQFKDFEHRGDVFRAAVKTLIAAQSSAEARV